jgi:hypothetical protein
MNGVEQNPYAASEVLVPETRQLSDAPRLSLRVLQNLFFAVLFCLSFLFLGFLVKTGRIAGAFNYTVFFVTEYPLLVLAIVLTNALLRQLLLPKLHARMFWLPIVGGVASFCSFDVVHPYFDAINQMIISQEWDSGTVEFVSGGIAPSFIGILIEGIGHGMHFFVKSSKRKHIA